MYKKIMWILLLLLNISIVNLMANEKEPDDDPNFNSLPQSIEKDITEIFKFIDCESNLNLNAVANLSDFIIKNSKATSMWKLNKREKIGNGAALFMQGADNLERRLPLQFSPEFPDYVMYPVTLRYSEGKDAAYQAYSNIVKIPATNSYTFGKYMSEEYTAPNKQSGACYLYTNMRYLIRANIAGTNVVLSIGNMLERSSSSIQGTEVETSHSNLFYYSSKTGLALPGLSWVNSQIYGSRSLIVFASAETNQLYYGAFSWINAGYKNINIIFSGNIRDVLLQTVKIFHDITDLQNLNINDLSDLIKKVAKLSEKEVNEYYEIYCEMVRKCSEDGKRSFINLKTASTLNNIFNEKDLKNVEKKYKCALITQEIVRHATKKSGTWLSPEKFQKFKNKE